MSVGATLIAMAAVLVLWPIPVPHRRLEQLVGSGDPVVGRRFDPWHSVWAVPIIGVLAFGPAPGVAGALLAGLIARQHRRTLRDAERDRDERDLIAALAVMGAELSVGAPLVGACRAAASELASTYGSGTVGPELARIAARAELGGDPGASAAHSGSVRRLAEAWSTSLRFGLPAVDVLAALRSDLVARQDFAARTKAGLAGPRATAAVLAGLPILGLLLGEAMGAGPIGILLQTGIGGVLLVIGTGLSVGGVLWSGRITDKVMSR